MAITKLVLAKSQPDIDFNASVTEFEENWLLTSDVSTRPSMLTPLIKNIGSSNAFGFPIIGTPHPSDASVLAVKYNLGKKNR